MASSYLLVCLLNAFLSYTATMLNIVTIHAIRKTPSLSKNLKTLLLSLAVSDLGVGLVAQPLYVARLIMESQLNIETSKTYNAIYIAHLVSANLFGFATLFLVIVLCAERFIAIHYYLRYQQLVTHKRVVAVVVSTWVLSGLFSLTIEAVDPKEYYVRGFWHYTTCMYYSCHFLQCQNLLVRATSRERNASAAATTCTTERSNG